MRYVTLSMELIVKRKNQFSFAPCIVIQLCNPDQQMHIFQNKVLIQFLESCTCFEHYVFIIRKTICTYSIVRYVSHKEMKITLYKISYKIACTNGLPEDEHMMFELCRRRQELN